MPSFELLGKLIPQVEAEVVPQIQENLSYWQELDKRKQKIKDGQKSLPPPKSPRTNRRSVVTTNGTTPKSPKKPKSDKSMESTKSKKKDKKRKDKRKKDKRKHKTTRHGVGGKSARAAV